MREFLYRLERDNITVVLLLTGIVVASSFYADAGSRPLAPWGLVLVVVACASLSLRHRYPVAVVAVASTAAMAYYVSGFPDGLVILPAMVALVNVVIMGRRLQGWLFGLGFYSAFHTFEIVVLDQPFAAHALGNLSWVLLFLISGEVVRKQRETEAARRERAEEALRVREEELRRLASDERLRLAREVHDVVAHNISLINVQAGTALYLIDAEPGRARDALATIKATSKDTLRELRSTLGVLRAVDEGAPRSPAPGLDRLPELVERSRATGVEVSLASAGEPGALPANVQAAAYRIVQESLTNAVRHAAAAHIRVGLERDCGGLTVEVTDDGRGVSAEFRPGNGITGMRERAMLLGGELSAGPRPDGGFRVRARLPEEAAPGASDRADRARQGSEHG